MIPWKKKECKPLVLLDCRRLVSLSFSPHNDPNTATASAHSGRKPEVGDYLAFKSGEGLALYRATWVNHCWNVDPPHMWIAEVEFVPGRIARTLDLPPLAD